VIRDRCRWVLAAAVLVLSLGLLLPVRLGHAAGLVDVPLKPWTYFEVNRDWTYTAIEKLVTAGLVGPWVLNTKPMSRIEMARVVAVALRKIQEDDNGRLARRSDLEPTLYALMDELAPELRTLGIRNGDEEFVGQPMFQLQPISHLQVRGFGARHDSTPENSQGLKLAKSYNITTGFDGYMQFGDFLSGYLYPEFQVDKQGKDGRLVEGYLKLQYSNVALRVGRESVWWGPGYHGSMMFSNNAPPLDQIRIGTAEPFVLPGFLKYLGPTRMEMMYARLEANRDFPHTMLGSLRLDITPFPFLELGAARTVQFGGQGRPTLNPLDYVLIQVVSKDALNSKYNSNTLYTLDATLRLHDVDRVFPLSRDLSLYTELEVDDTCCQGIIWPFKPAYMVGLYLPNLFRRDGSELRVEWASSTSFTYTNGIYTSGVSLDGFPLGHYIGARGQDLYIRSTEKILPNLQIGSELGYTKVGSTEFSQLTLPREERKYVGADISYRPIPPLSLLLGYRYERTNNKNFVAGQRETNQIVRLEATYSFAPWESTQFGRLRRGEALKPVAPSPEPREEEAPDIDQDEVLSVNYVKRLFKDTGTMLTSPLRWETRDWLVFGGVGLATGGLMFADKGIRNYVQKNKNGATDTLASIFRPFETIVPVVLVAGIGGWGYAFDQPKLKAAAADALEASLISVGVFSVPMKFFSGRARPDRNMGPAHYDPLTLGSSLPSFTTANAFTVASVLAEHFPHPAVSILAYGLAGAAGLTRIYDDKHWTSDVLLGAAIGIAVGKAVVKLNEMRREGSKVSVVPLLGDGMRGAALQVEF
jgi:membrane-associated phospholipid phosphatase